MKKNYEFAIREVLKSEGGYTNDPKDSGGATNFGITIGDYRKYINKNGTPKDVKNMTVDQAKAIYKARYWDAIGADKLESGVDFTCFDYGVNSGIGRPQKVLQKFKNLKGNELIDAINNERKAFLEGLIVRRPKDEKYRNGWMSRVERVRKQSHFLNAQKVDNTTGPAAGAAAGIGLFATLQHYITAHPYISIAIAVGAGAAIWALIHWIRNR